MKDVADMIADICKFCPLTYPKVVQCDNGSEFKAEVPKMQEKHRLIIRHTTTKYKYTHIVQVYSLVKNMMASARETLIELWVKKTDRLSEVSSIPCNRVMYHLKDVPQRVFVKEELMLIPEDTELPLDYVQK